MTLSEFVILIKRDCRYGDIANVTDQVTKDIIQYLNARAFELWRHRDWDWSREPISVTLVAGTAEYSLASTIGEITVLEAGEDNFLTVLSLKRYLEWFKRENETQGAVTHYVRLGRDASGNLKVKFWRTPSASGTVTGYGKKRLTAYAIGDIATNTGLTFFPVETHDVLFTGVRCDVLRQMGQLQPAAFAESDWTRRVASLWADEDEHPDAPIQTPPPRMYVRKKRGRGGTTVL